MNKYLLVAIILITIFFIITIAISPNLNFSGSRKPATIIIETDSNMLFDVINSRIPWLNSLMIFMTEYGREVIWPIFVVLIAIFGGQEGRNTALIITISIIALIPISVLAKDMVARPRPVLMVGQTLLSTDNEYSYPSGHATIVAAGAATSLALFRSNRKVLISIAMTVEAALVCISRIYLGHHYPIDVVGGIILGVGVSFIFVGLSKNIERSLLSFIRKVSMRFNR